MKKKVPKLDEVKYITSEQSLIHSDSDSDEEMKRREEGEIKRIIVDSKKKRQEMKKQKYHLSQNLNQRDLTNPSEVNKSDNYHSAFLQHIAITAAKMKEAQRTPVKVISSAQKNKLKDSKYRIPPIEPYNYYDDILDSFQNFSSFDENGEPTHHLKKSLSRNIHRIKVENQDKQKEAYEQLVHHFNLSTSKTPTHLFDALPSTHKIDEMSKTVTEKTQKQIFIKTETDVQIRKTQLLRQAKSDQYLSWDEVIESIYQSLEISFDRMQISLGESKMPKTVLINWKKWAEEMELSKFLVIVVDAIAVTVDACVEIQAGSEEMNKEINACFKETEAFNSEAKHVMIFSYNNRNQKALFLSKFLCYAKKKRSYPKGFQDEKKIREKQSYIKVNQESVRDSREKALKILKAGIIDQDDTYNYLKEHIMERIYIERSIGYDEPESTKKRDQTGHFDFDFKEFLSQKLKANQLKIELPSKILMPTMNMLTPKIMDRSSSGFINTTVNDTRWATIGLGPKKMVSRLQIIPNKVNFKTSSSTLPDDTTLDTEVWISPKRPTITKGYSAELKTIKPKSPKPTIISLNPKELPELAHTASSKFLRKTGCFTPNKTRYRFEKPTPPPRS